MMSAEKRNLFILIALFIFFVIAAIYFLLFRQGGVSTPFYIKDPETGEFEKTLTRPSDPNLLDLGPSNQGDNFSLTRVLKGYFHEYNSNKNTVSLKNEFRNSPILQLLEVSLGSTDKFYCWPESVTGNGASIPTQSLTFRVEPDGRDIVMPTERQFSLDLLSNTIQTDKYVVIQLQDAFRSGGENIVQKLIVLGC